MSMNRVLISSQVVEIGQPDKVCDIIADSILDGYLKQDPRSKCDINVALTKDLVLVNGEVSSAGSVQVEKIVRDTLREVGYTDASFGIDPYRCEIIEKFQRQSQDIARGIYQTESKVMSAGDLGTIYGYATNETPEYFPLPYLLAHQISQRLTHVRQADIVKSLLPDGQVQVTMDYEGDKPTRIDSVVVTCHHSADADTDWLRMEVSENVVNAVCKKWTDSNTKILVNTGGRFIIGGPSADSGMSGHLIENETYGGIVKYGGCSFAGKDPSKINRTIALQLRECAKDIVMNKMAAKCQIFATYAIGIAEPVALDVDTFGTSSVDEEEILAYLKQNYVLLISDIVKKMRLEQVSYKDFAVSNGVILNTVEK